MTSGSKSMEAVRPVDFVKKVGRGKTLSQDLTATEAGRAFGILLEGGFSATQFGAFLQALRIKELTQDELDALVGLFQARQTALPPLQGSRTLVLNMASDTARKGGMASLLAAAGLRRFGIGVGVVRSAPVLSGNLASFDGSWALARTVDPEIGPLPLAAGQTRVSEAAGPAIASAPPLRLAACADLVPGLAALDPLRGELGFRSCLHTAEKLVNPWPASPMLLGISHKHYALRMAGAMRTQGLQGRVLLGNHGTVDLVLHKETEMVAAGPEGIREESVSPADLGLTLSSDVYSLGRFSDWGAWLKDPKGAGAALDDVILYHRAVFLWAAGAAPDPAAGLRMARSA